MATTSAPVNQPARPGIRAKRTALAVGLTLLAALAIVAAIALHDWPYRYERIKPMLDKTLAGDVELHHYHRVYFPRPGFAADDLTLRRRSDDPTLPPLGTARTLVVDGTWLDLLRLRHRVALVRIEGLHLDIPAPGTRQRNEDFPPGSSHDFTGPSTSIGKFSIHDALLEVRQRDGTPIRFAIARLVLHDMQRGQPLRYTLEMTNPKPTGHILAKGNFGPVDSRDPGNTPISGDFQFTHVQLRGLSQLRGEVTASGHFDNILSAITSQSEIDTPAFAVGTSRPIHVHGTAQCTINGLNGDVDLRSVNLTMGSTPVHMHGTVTGRPKVARVEIEVPRGRVQDLMQPFNHNPPPVVGPVAMRAHAEILPNKTRHEGFLTRLVMSGTFTLPDDLISNPTTEQKLSAFSQRAQSHKDETPPPPDTDALSSLTGTATVRDGLVTTHALHFAVAGAAADLDGTYSFRNKTVHMTGNLTMQRDLSHVATGFKSALLKPLAPFFKHKDVGTVVPIAVTGSPGAYRVTSNILHKK